MRGTATRPGRHSLLEDGRHRSVTDSRAALPRAGLRDSLQWTISNYTIGDYVGTKIRRKCFLSYHKDDQQLVDNFIADFDDSRDLFIMRGIRAPEDLINSKDTDYVMSQIRKRFLADSTVTIVLIGSCTWARRFVDWEIQASLRQPADGLPNGLVAINLENGKSRTLPDRLRLNVESGYSKFYKYPSSSSSFSTMIEEAFEARTSKANFIKNPRDRYSYNRNCG